MRSESVIRVLVVDDHETVRQGLRAVLHMVSNLVVAGEVADGAWALHAVIERKPDVVLMDLSMPTSGLGAIRQITAAQPGVSVVVFSRHAEDAFVRAAFEAGACGYVLKQSSVSELISGILAVTEGQHYLDSSLSIDVLQHPGIVSVTLTRPEREVIRQAALGMTNQAIAVALAIPVMRVEAHRMHAMRKLRLETRSDLTRYAVEHGWLGAARRHRP